MNSIYKRFSKVELLGHLLTKKVKSKNIKTLSEEVNISIHNLSSAKKFFNYNLLLINKDKNKNSNWDNISFEIKESIELSLFSYNDAEYLQWNTEKNIYFLEILLDDHNNENQKKNFFKILNRCLYSIINNISFEEVSNEIDINSINYIKNIGLIENLENYADKKIIFLEDKRNNEILEDQITKEINNLEITHIKLDKIINLETSKKIFCAQGEMYNYDTNKEELVNLNVDKKSFLTVYHLSKFDYILCSETLNEYIISLDKINNEIKGQIITDKNKKFFCWTTNKCYINIIGNCIGFIFDKNEDCEIFKKLLDKTIYESINKQKYEYDFVINKSISEKEIKNNSFSSNEEDEKEESEKCDDEEINNDYYEIMDIDEEYNEIESSKEDFNKFSLTSLTNDRTYCITDENKIVSYKISQETDSIEKISSIPIIQQYNENDNCFNNGMLYKNENNILFLDENNPYSLYQYDITKEKIINKWKTENILISDICPLKKNGQTTDDSIIYGVNSKSIFIMDDRVNNKNNIVEIKNYSRNIHFNKIISTNNGRFATGTKKGELRLYDKIGNRAKNLYSFYGHEIRHIDISSDEEFLLITFDKYLLLVNVMNCDGQKSGFYKNLKSNDRKEHIKLKINKNDLSKYELIDSNYTAAKFNLNKNGENNIITSLGDYIIIWNFSDIKRGKITNYKIKKVNDFIVDNSFKFGNNNKIIITMSTRIRIQNQKKTFTK